MTRRKHAQDTRTAELGGLYYYGSERSSLSDPTKSQLSGHLDQCFSFWAGPTK